MSLLDGTEAEKFLQPQTVNESCENTAVEHEAYRLGAEDIIEIEVYDEDGLSDDYTVSQTGTIDMPLIGTVLVAGCTLPQAQHIILRKYTDGYLIDPSITLEMNTYRPFYILGEVKSPGKYDYGSDLTLYKAAALAGGFTYRADQEEAEILRSTVSNAQLYKTQNLETKVRPGDVIFIKERLF